MGSLEFCDRKIFGEPLRGKDEIAASTDYVLKLTVDDNSASMTYALAIA